MNFYKLFDNPKTKTVRMLLLFAFTFFISYNLFRINEILGWCLIAIYVLLLIFKLALYVGRFMKDDKHYTHR